MYWCIDELGAHFIVNEKTDDTLDGEHSVPIVVKEVFMIIPSEEKSIVYLFSEFDYGGRVQSFLK